VNNNQLKKRLILSVLVCLLLAAATSCSLVSANAKTGTGLQTITILRKSNTKNGTLTTEISSFKVEVVSNAKSRNKGLSGRSELPAGHGMLFILDNSRENYFWMKEMNFSIDIILFDSRKRVTEIYENLPLCTVCPFIKLKKPVSYALEINSGEATKFGINAGDLFELTED